MSSDFAPMLYQDRPQTEVLNALRAMADDLEDRALWLVRDAQIDAQALRDGAQFCREMAVKGNLAVEVNGDVHDAHQASWNRE